MNELDAAGYGGRETETIVGPEDVVVHRLGNSDNGDVLDTEPRGVGERVVTADRHQHVDSEPIQHPRHVWCAVDATIGAGQQVARAAQDLGQPVERHVRWIYATGVQKGPTRAIDRARVLSIQFERAGAQGCRLVGMQFEHAAPATPNADDLPVPLGGGVYESLDAGVETRHVASTSEHTNSHSPPPAPGRHRL